MKQELPPPPQHGERKYWRIATGDAPERSDIQRPKALPMHAGRIVAIVVLAVVAGLGAIGAIYGFANPDITALGVCIANCGATAGAWIDLLVAAGAIGGLIAVVASRPRERS